MTKSKEKEKKLTRILNRIIIIAVVIYEMLVVTLLYRELIASSLRATQISLVLLGLLFLPLLFLVLGKSLGGTRLFNLKAGSFQVQIENLDEKIEKKTRELAKQLEGKVSTAEQTLYPLVGGKNEFANERLSKNRLIIASKDFAANIVVAEFTAQYLEINGIQCDRRFRNGGTTTNYASLANGWIDMFIDYTGTGCMMFNVDFREKSTGEFLSADEILKILNEITKKRYQFEWLRPLGEKTKTNYCLVMRQDIADKGKNENKIKNISNINVYGHGRLRFCANFEFMNRLDGFLGMKDKYNLRFLSEDIVSYADRYNYLVNDEADVSVGHTTDPEIRTLNLKILEDDRKFFPDYFETPLVRSDALAKVDGLSDIMNDLPKLQLTNEDISLMIHDYNTNADSLSKSAHKILLDKLSRLETANKE